MIKIDLRNLTQEMVDQAIEIKESHEEGTGPFYLCRYTTPCIIGQLMTQQERSALKDNNHDATAILRLKDDRVVQITPGQFGDTGLLQDIFDRGSIEDFKQLAKNMLEKYSAENNRPVQKEPPHESARPY